MLQDSMKEIVEGIKENQVSLHDVHKFMAEMLEAIDGSAIPQIKGYGGGCGTGTGGGC